MLSVPQAAQIIRDRKESDLIQPQLDPHRA
jgi:hypothetical protein